MFCSMTILYKFIRCDSVLFNFMMIIESFIGFFTMIFHPLHVNPEAPTAADKCWKKAQLGEVDLLSH